MMSAIAISPSVLSGTITVPPSKSLLHRGLVCAALAGDPTLCEPPDETVLSEDIRATRACLEAIAAAGQKQEPTVLDCGESGTTLRLIIPLLAARGIQATLHGGGRLPNRPLAEYARAFEDHGVSLTFPETGAFLPLRLDGRLTPGTFALPGNVSSQYISGLLLALPLLDGDSEITLTAPLESEPYVNMTLDVMRHFGVTATPTSGGYHVPGGQSYHTRVPYRPEPDFSQAAFWLLAAHLGHAVAPQTLPAHSAQGDRVFSLMLDTLRGARPDAVVELDVAHTPDLVPALAAAAAVSPGTTRIVNAARLRLKESDRIATTCNMLLAFGARVEPTADGLIVKGGTPRLRACTIDGSRDHRIVMTAAMLATRAEGPVVITDSRAIDKSYPTFFNDYIQAGGIAHELHVGN